MTMQQSDMERYNPLLMLKEVMAQTPYRHSRRLIAINAGESVSFAINLYYVALLTPLRQLNTSMNYAICLSPER